MDDNAIAEFTKHLKSGALEKVPDDERLSTNCLPLFAVVQDTKCRLIYDARNLNSSLSDPSFVMETVFDLPTLAEGMRFVGKLDLTQAYCQYPVQKDLSAHLGCIGPDGACFRWTVLPFGLSHSPRVFCSLTSAFVRRWRSTGIRCFSYVDDIIFMAASISEFVRAADTILSDLRDARVLVAPKKTFILPFTRLYVLGLRLDLNKQAWSVPPSKITKIATAASELIAEKSGSRKSLLSLIGRLGYASVACPYVIFFRAALLGSVGSGHLSEIINLPPQALDELQFWTSPDGARLLSTDWAWRRFCSHRVFAKHNTPGTLPDFTLWGDASEFGAGYNSSASLGLPASELLPENLAGNGVPSIVRELWVIVRLVELAQVPRGSCIRLISDNQGAVATANGSAVCASTAPLAQRLVRALTANDVVLQVEWAPRALLDDVDQRSRWDARDLSHSMCIPDDYAKIFAWAFGASSSAHTQLFACAGAALPNMSICSRLPEPNSLGCPFTICWREHGNLWGFPPFCLARPLLKKLVEEAQADSVTNGNLSICVLVPSNATSEAAFSALPIGWRRCPGPVRLLAPPLFQQPIACTVPLVLIASPFRPGLLSAPPRLSPKPPYGSRWDGSA
jgi:hypothetical protein